MPHRDSVGVTGNRNYASKNKEVVNTSEQGEGMKQAIKDVLANHFRGGIYACTRVWQAWQVGTMTQDDFIPLDEDDDFLEDLATELLNLKPLTNGK